jgi:hypothetical protein
VTSCLYIYCVSLYQANEAADEGFAEETVEEIVGEVVEEIMEGLVEKIDEEHAEVAEEQLRRTVADLEENLAFYQKL